MAEDAPAPPPKILLVFLFCWLFDAPPKSEPDEDGAVLVLAPPKSEPVVGAAVLVFVFPPPKRLLLLEEEVVVGGLLLLLLLLPKRLLLELLLKAKGFDILKDYRTGQWIKVVR